MVERWKASGMPLAKIQTRFNKKGWGNIIGGILEANGEPDFMANARMQPVRWMTLAASSKSSSRRSQSIRRDLVLV